MEKDQQSEKEGKTSRVGHPYHPGAGKVFRSQKVKRYGVASDRLDQSHKSG